MRAVFVRAAIAAVAGFAVLGLFTAVSPAFLGEVLHDANHAPVGVVVVCLFAASVGGQLASTRLGERALTLGCGLLAVGIAIVGASLPARSLTLLLVGAAVAGLGQGQGQGLSFRAGRRDASPAQLRGEVNDRNVHRLDPTRPTAEHTCPAPSQRGVSVCG